MADFVGYAKPLPRFGPVPVDAHSHTAVAGRHKFGIGAVAVRCSSHFGIGALFAEQAVAVGMVGMAMTNAPRICHRTAGEGASLRAKRLLSVLAPAKAPL